MPAAKGHDGARRDRLVVHAVARQPYTDPHIAVRLGIARTKLSPAARPGRERLRSLR